MNFLKQIEKQAEDIKRQLRARARISVSKVSEVSVILPSGVSFAEKLKPKPATMDLSTQHSVLRLADKVR